MRRLSELELSDAVYGIEPNIPVMHQCVRYLMARDRQGTHDTKGRSEVRGGGRKPWRQKGTGRARQGSIRAPQWRGGGVVFGPTPRDHSFRMNKKEIKLAMRSALSAKLADARARRDRQVRLREALHQGRRQVHRGPRPWAASASPSS